MQHRPELARRPCNEQRFLLLICLALFSVMTRAAGIRELLIPPDAKGPEISARLWTPCAVAPSVMAVGRAPSISLKIEAVKDCAPLGKDFPLIVMPGYEPRIKAFVIADPVSLFPDKASLRKIVAPIQLWSSERSGMGVRPEDVALVAKHLPKDPDYHRPANSGHFSFLFPCSSEVAKADPFECADSPGFDRANFHRRFNAQAVHRAERGTQSQTHRSPP
ncbi:MAG: hypothetical protein ACJ8R9_27165 [Steroidobacteraceae bacterium]